VTALRRIAAALTYRDFRVLWVGAFTSTIGTWMDKAIIREIETTLGEDLPRCTVPGVSPYVEMKPRVTLGNRRGVQKVKRR
jgi:hypothetical protein